MVPHAGDRASVVLNLRAVRPGVPWQAPGGRRGVSLYFGVGLGLMQSAVVV